MKPIYFFHLVGLVTYLSLSTGCGNQQQKMEYIGVDEAKKLALEDAVLSVSTVKFTAADLANRSGTDYYQIDFTSEGQKYKYDIDALTGVIIDADMPDNESSSKSTNSTDQSDSSPTSSTLIDQNSNLNDTMLTSEEAKAAALKHAGLSSEQVTFIKTELDYDHKIQIYEIEFYSDDKEYDYEIDAYTGEIIAYDFDAEDIIPSANNNSKMITEKKAKELALSQVPGATENDIYEFEVDKDDGHTEYEGKILYNDMEYEFEIDAYSGAFRSWEAEPID